MNPAELATRLKKMLGQVAPNGDLSALAVPGQKSGSKNLESLETVSPEVKSGLEKLSRGAVSDLSASELYNLEAIVLPENRPVTFVHGSSYDDLAYPWTSLNESKVKATLGKTFASIGRIELPNSPLIPYGGTGFIVGDGLMMTNRHVAQLFSQGLGLTILYTPGNAAVDFKREVDDPEADAAARLPVAKVEMIHPYWDMALLRIDGLPIQTGLPLSVREAKDLVNLNVVVVGYPAMDPRNNIALQNRIFDQTYNVKRLQPGIMRPAAEIRSFENTVNAITHDASTLGGNSGSAVLDAGTGEVLALHFAGEYLKANYAIPMYELARDAKLAKLLSFTSSVAATTAYDAAWSAVKSVESAPSSSRPAQNDGAVTTSSPFSQAAGGSALPVPQADSNRLQVTLPIVISISLGQPVTTLSLTAQSSSLTSAPQALENVVVDQDYSDRPGYDPDFLEGLHLPLPTLTNAMKKISAEVDPAQRIHGDTYELAYYHYSVYMNKQRRTAWFSAANVDGKQRPAIGNRQGDRWYRDTRILPSEQLTQNAFESGIDRGHLTRREDTAWGKDVESATRANNDTFHFTNCGLQVSAFNRSKGRWQGLEQFLLEKHAKRDKRTMTVITGPVFAGNDPVYQNENMNYSVRCPLQYWKVCALIREDGSASATGFILGQDDIKRLPGFEETFDVGVAQVTLAHLEQLTGLSFGDLKEHDHFATGGPSGTLETLGSPCINLIRRATDIVT